MNRRRTLSLATLVAAGLIGGSGVAGAQGRVLRVGAGEELPEIRAALAAAADGDTIEVRGGSYRGPIEIARSVRLVGVGDPTIDGGGQGTVVTISAPGVRLEGFVVRGSGESLDEENSAITVAAPRADVIGNRLVDVLFGVYLKNAPESRVEHNRIAGRDLPMARRGDPIRVWYSDGARLVDNEVVDGRDVVLWYSKGLEIEGNSISGGRYGLHFMYCDDARIERNRLVGNSVGSFLMYSRRLRLVRNLIAHNRGPSGYGVGLKDMDDGIVASNLMLDNRVGVFSDTSPREIAATMRITDNVFAYNDTALELQPSTMRNAVAGNSFIDNGESVAVLGGGELVGNDWSESGRGNYWDDYAGYDADGDGVGDVPYRAMKLFERLADAHPELRIFWMSPATRALDLAARAFPIVAPRPKLVDDHPLLSPRVPEGVPLPARADGAPFASGAAGLLALAAAIPLGARFGARGRRHADAGVSRETTMIRISHLTKRFDAVTAVEDLSLAVAKGEALALWGGNGAGKTTALRAILGVLPVEGAITIEGRDLALDGRACRRRIGFVPQELAFHDDLTVDETWTFYARLKRADATASRRWLRRLELDLDAGKRVRELSGGMKRRLALALALVGDPPILLLDEPTANLDAASRDSFLALLGELKAEGKTLLFTSHRAQDVLELADRVVALDRGRSVAEGTAREILGGVAGDEVTLRLPAETVAPALAALARAGFIPRKNGQGLVLAPEAAADAPPLAPASVERPRVAFVREEA